MFGIISQNTLVDLEIALAKKRRRKRQRQLDMAVATIHRRYGPGALIKGRSSRRNNPITATAYISTGFPNLDQALGSGGLPKGQICELLGPTTSGKTTVALKFLAQAQAGGKQVAYIDQALYFDPDYAHRCGLNLSSLLIGTPYDLGEALAMTEALARSGELAALVFDALDFVWTDPIAASLLAATLSRLPAPLARSGTALLILHETSTSSSPTPSALAHHAAMRLQVIRERWLYRHGDIRGYKARVEILKNRQGPTGRAVSIAIEFNGTVRGNGL